MIKVVLFDVDGVLVPRVKFSIQLARDYGISLETTAPFFDGIFKECMEGKADLKHILPPYLTQWGWQGSVDDFLNYWFKSEHIIDEKLVEYVQKLRKRGIKCHLATNQEKHRAKYILDKMGFSESFDKVYVSAHLGHKKPSIEFYKKVMEDISGIQKNEVLFWDDKEINVVAAREFGINAEFYISFDDFKNKMKDYLK